MKKKLAVIIAILLVMAIVIGITLFTKGRRRRMIWQMQKSMMT